MTARTAPKGLPKQVWDEDGGERETASRGRSRASCTYTCVVDEASGRKNGGRTAIVKAGIEETAEGWPGSCRCCGDGVGVVIGRGWAENGGRGGGWQHGDEQNREWKEVMQSAREPPEGCGGSNGQLLVDMEVVWCGW